MKKIFILSVLLMVSLSVRAQSASEDNGMGVEARILAHQAENGDPTAQMSLGMFYQLGHEVEQNWEKGFELIKQAADQGNTDALQLLACCYFNGWGTEKNNSEAIRILEAVKEVDPDTDWIDQMITNIVEGDTLSAYEFQFWILPERLMQYKFGDFSRSELIDLAMLRMELGSMFISHYECNLDSLSISMHEVGDCDVFVIRMPEPKDVPLCKYAAFVIDTSKPKCCYYTLEKTFNLFDDNDEDPFMVGRVGISSDEENSDGENFNHYNYGRLEGEPTEENFVNRVTELFNKE